MPINKRLVLYLRGFKMSESFYVLISQADDYFPGVDVVNGFIDKYSMMDSAAIYSAMIRIPLVNQSLPMLRDFVSDMTREEIAKELIACLDIHYHELLEEINQNDHKRQLFRGAMSLVLDDLMGVGK